MQLEIGRRLGFIDERGYSELIDRAGQVGRMLHGLIASIEKGPQSGFGSCDR
ncbi:MAG: hypothetical protein HOP16_15090 [Acidobacteria bacterium]|nr:hypothetical protein [Acidobacteriota bacterium]